MADGQTAPSGLSTGSAEPPVPTPESAPAPATETPTPEPTAAPWEQLGLDLDGADPIDDDVIEVSSDGSEEYEGSDGTEPPVKEPPAQVPPEPAAKAEGPVAPEPKPEPKETPAPEADASSPPSGSTILEQLQANQDALLGEFARRFALSDEDVEELQDAPKVALPKFAARLYFDTMLAVQKQIQHAMQSVPTVIQGVTQQKEAHRAAWDSFFEAWPALKGSKYRGEVEQMATRYVTAFPGATFEQVVEDVGALAMQRFKLTPAAPPKTPQPPKPAEPGFRPAVGGVPAGHQPTVHEPFVGMGLDYD